MKYLKKINKGLILTIIAILAVAIYTNILEKQRETEKNKIQTACNEFIEYTNKYLVYPENMQILNEDIKAEDREKFYDEAETELRKLMIENDEAVKLQFTYFKSIIEQQNNKRFIKTKVDRKISKITGYEFDEDQVTVTFNSKIETTSKYLDVEEEKIKKDSNETSKDEIILKKVGEQWKVVSSNIQFYGYVNDTIMF